MNQNNLFTSNFNHLFIDLIIILLRLRLRVTKIDEIKVFKH